MGANKDDIKPGNYPVALDWTQADVKGPLETIYTFVDDECRRAIDWYFSKRHGKRVAGYLCRVGAIVAFGLSGVIPVLSEIYKTSTGPGISPAWATVALAAMAFLIALDHLVPCNIAIFV